MCVFLSALGSRGDLLTRGQRVRSQECAPLLSIGPDGDWHSHLTWKAALSPEVCYARLSVCVCVRGGGTPNLGRRKCGEVSRGRRCTLRLLINSGSELQARYNHESEQQDSFQAASLPWPLTWYDWDRMSQRQWESHAHIHPGDVWESAN